MDKHNSNQTNDLLIFMHIPKTGGSTLNSILKNQYKEFEKVATGGFWGTKPPWINPFSEKKIEKLQCIRGHSPFGVHEHFQKPFTYFTMLRDPVERLISLYYFVRTGANVPMHDRVKELTMKQFMEHDDFKIQTVNMQTRYISGGDPSNLQLAKENLNNYFSVVGITEMYNESIFLMSQEFGWKNLKIKYEKQRVNPHRLTKEQIPQEIIDIIVKNNKFDIELYEFAKQKFIERIASLDSKSKEKLKNFTLFS